MPLTLGNRVTEKDIRDWLDKHDSVGRTAKIHGLELHAIQRPGWVQVFEFQARFQIRNPKLYGGETDDHEDESDPQWVDRFGVVLDDERNRTQDLRTQIWVFAEQDEQLAKLESVSQGMLVRNSGTNMAPLIWIAITAVLFFAIVSLISWIT